MPEDADKNTAVSSDQDCACSSKCDDAEMTAETFNTDDEKMPQCTQGDDDGLDKLDELPENKKRASIILAVIGVLTVFALVTLFVMPPLSWSPQKDVKSDYVPAAVIENVSHVEARDVELAYRNIDSQYVYDAEIEQDTTYPGGAVSKFRLKAAAVIDRPLRRNYDDEIAIKLQDVEVHIFDGDKEISLASAGRLLEGIYIYSRLGSKHGMYSIVPDANINPQIARMLFAFSDAIRQMWPPLPEENVGTGAAWSFVDNPEAGSDITRTAKASINSCHDGICTVAVDVALKKSNDGNERSDIGNGNAEIKIRDGRVMQATGKFSRKQPAMNGAAAIQDTSVRFSMRL